MKKPRGRARRLRGVSCLGMNSASGFTLVELVFTASIGLLLTMTLFEALLFSRRSAAHMRHHLAADAYAFDVAWDVFNRRTAWFDNNANNPTSFPAAWSPVPADRTSAFGGASTNQLFVFLSIRPNGIPVTSWQIMTDMRWRQPNNVWRQLPQPYVIERHRADRNLFRTGP